jgi:hypothetical protein
MPAQQLLEVLNERLVADFGPDEEPHTMEQLYAEIGEVDARRRMRTTGRACASSSPGRGATACSTRSPGS